MTDHEHILLARQDRDLAEWMRNRLLLRLALLSFAAATAGLMMVSYIFQ